MLMDIQPFIHYTLVIMIPLNYAGNTMKNSNYLVPLICAVSVGTGVKAEPVINNASQQLFEIQNTCIIKFNDSISKFDVEGMARGMLTSVNAKAKHIYTHSIKGMAVKLNCAKAKSAFVNYSEIVSYEHDGLVVAFPRKEKPTKPGGGDTPSAAETTPWGVTHVGGPVPSKGQTAWILDTGIDLEHLDLNVDTSRGYSAFSKGRNAGFDDGHGHGTHVAGTIAAIDNDIDVVGIAAGTTVVPVKVLDSRGSGSYSGIIAGIDHVAEHGQPGDCANLSLGGGYSELLNGAVTLAASKGVYFALAAGNESQNANNVSPASANGTNVYTISAIASNNNFASFSNYGNPPIDYAAPGVNILSLKKGGGTTTMSGTSMAAPHACAVLMITGGVPSSLGTANGDPDGNADPVIHL